MRLFSPNYRGLRFSVAVVLLWLVACAGGDPTETEVKQRMVSTARTVVIEPSYEDLKAKATSISEAVNELCNVPSVERLADARDAWIQAAKSWATIQQAGIGPIKIDNNDLRVSFYPDDNGLTERQVNTLLASDAVINAESLSGESASVQGLSGLEWVLFDDAFTERWFAADTRLCAYGVAAANYTSTLITDVLSQWLGEFGESFVASDAAVGSLSDYLNAHIALLEFIKLQKLSAPLSENSAGIKAAVESPHARISLELIRDNLVGLRDAYNNKLAYGFDDYLRELLEAYELNSKVLDQYVQTISRLDSIDSDLQQALTTESGRAQVEALLNDVSTLIGFYKGDLAQAVDVYVSFNANDGD